MNILITGCNGFLGSELTNFFKKNHNVLATNRQILDPRDIDNVRHIFNNNKIDIVLHTAIKGGRRGEIEDIDTFLDNIKMFDNLISQKDKFKLMINFGSGAEFDRTTDILNAKEEDVLNFFPKDYYGLCKNFITRKILKLDSNVINLRIFGCFGTNEEEQRLFKNSIKKIKQNINPIVHQDKFMDYFYIQDVCRSVNYFINNIHTLEYKDYNLVYSEKYKLTELIKKIPINQENLQIEVINKDVSLNYTGCGKRLETLKIDLIGLQKGIDLISEQ